MNRILTALALGAALQLSACGGAPRDARQEIGAASAAFTAAYAAGNARDLAGLYTESAQLAPPNSRFVTAREEIAFFWEGAMAAGATRLDRTLDEAEIRGDTAWELGRYELKDPQGEVLDRGKYLVIWKESGGQWRIHRDIWNTSRLPRRARPAPPTDPGTPAR